jgi:hypothetical protein
MRTGKPRVWCGSPAASSRQLTASSYAIERRDEMDAGDVAQLYAPFDPVIPLASLG